MLPLVESTTKEGSFQISSSTPKSKLHAGETVARWEGGKRPRLGMHANEKR
jgi:hypothetical protein